MALTSIIEFNLGEQSISVDENGSIVFKDINGTISLTDIINILSGLIQSEQN